MTNHKENQMSYSQAIHHLLLHTDRKARFTAEVFCGGNRPLEFWVVDNEADDGYGMEVALCDNLTEAVEFAERANLQPAIATNDLSDLASFPIVSH
jgi:hypothetical protein